MNDYSALMDAGVAAVRIHSATSFSWFGERNPQLSNTIRAAISPSDAREYLLYSLQLQLYRNFYCPGAPVPAGILSVGGHRGVSVRADFVARLSAANTGVGSLEPGWHVHAVDADRVVVERSGLLVWIKYEQLCLTDGALPEPGVSVSIRQSKELPRRSPGFYLALGNHGMKSRDVDPVVRLYWNVIAESAPQLVELVTTRLNAADIPFRLKTINDARRYTRCDAAVLYGPKRCYPAIAEIVAGIHAELAASLVPGTPAFTKRLAPGLALAEDPGTGDSFGMHRCRLFAEGILNAREDGRRSTSARRDSVIAAFAAAGITTERPYLNPGSADTYQAVSE